MIDFENVHSDGLEGCQKLESTDHIIIFFTQNAKNLDMSGIAKHGGADFEMVEVPAGKQSADIHIASYLGYLAGKYSEDKCEIVIVSQDTDYDNVIKFWKKQAGIKITRRQKIQQQPQKIQQPQKVQQTQQPKKTTQQQPSKKKVTPTKTPVNVSGEKKTKLNQEIMQAARTIGYDTSTANKIAKLSTGMLGSRSFLNDVMNAFNDEWSNGAEVYEDLKSVLSKYANVTARKTVSQTATAKDKSAVNKEVMQILSKAGLSNDVVTKVASIVVKNHGVKKGKQTAYRTIVSRYGQEKGLDIYKRVKKYI